MVYPGVSIKLSLGCMFSVRVLWLDKSWGISLRSVAGMNVKECSGRERGRRVGWRERADVTSFHFAASSLLVGHILSSTRALGTGISHNCPVPGLAHAFGTVAIFCDLHLRAVLITKESNGVPRCKGQVGKAFYSGLEPGGCQSWRH